MPSRKNFFRRHLWMCKGRILRNLDIVVPLFRKKISTGDFTFLFKRLTPLLRERWNGTFVPGARTFELTKKIIWTPMFFNLDEIPKFFTAIFLMLIIYQKYVWIDCKMLLDSSSWCTDHDFCFYWYLLIKLVNSDKSTGLNSLFLRFFQFFFKFFYVFHA